MQQSRKEYGCGETIASLFIRFEFQHRSTCPRQVTPPLRLNAAGIIYR
jgi:hypothetical protein